MVNTDSERSSDHERSVAIIKDTIHTFEINKESLPEKRGLEAYYASDVWNKDFALDEAGKLPKNLERGVLSEDGLYDLLEQNKEIMGMISGNPWIREIMRAAALWHDIPKGAHIRCG